MITTLFRVIIIIIALALILVGVITTPTPIPFGIVLIGCGLLLLVSFAPEFVRWVRKHWRWLDRKLKNLQQNGPGWIAKPLKRTDPDAEKEDAE